MLVMNTCTRLVHYNHELWGAQKSEENTYCRIPKGSQRAPK